MPPAKNKVRRAPANKATKAPSEPTKERAEFLVVTVPEKAQQGSTFKLLYVAGSLEEAEAHVNSLPGTSSRYFGILEKKAVLRREPVMRTTKAERNILPN